MGKTEIIVTIILFNLFFILFLIGIVVFIKQYKLKKKEHEDKLQHQQREHQQELLTTQLEIQTQTMQYIGREIHDNIGQKLTLASLYTQQLAYENKAPHINESIENISTIINDSLSELRQLSKSLTDDSIEQNPIAELLEEECKKINELKKCSVHFLYIPKIELQSYQIKSILLRITQEFLQNSIKHSNCKNIKVTFKKNNGFIELQLEDDGKGFDTIKMQSNGIGLLNMKKRAEIIGGTYVFESSIDKGTKLTIKIPH
ncbi:two-component sensor histidine kinase [Flavobacterium jejuense]|uniref:Oxygen sensor histidine kinase NreB n=1 Tax=Flavobacterium jejuense TaxID=1544455 RepID=A0ABX0IMN9_9FLAO|nr:ATP-binding protein [Flavobacterium jejuense]NHN25055.1 two-component sensor histidine kinase [Flavobacterium jejuense]